jgi:hypothetical protein
VRRTWAWLAGGFGIAAMLRGLRRRGATEEEAPIRYAPELDETPAPEPEPGVDPRAEELRVRLAEAKAAGSDRDEFEAGETTVDASEASVDLAARRRSLHEQGRAAIDEMRGGPGDSAA